MASSRNRSSTDLVHILADRLSRHVRPGQRICVALSGGVDSIVLMHACVAAAPVLRLASPIALHVHHGLSPNADAWAACCSDICRHLGVRLEVRRVTVQPDGDGLEAAARRARHAEFNTVDADWVVLGHHRDDQAETMLLNLLRGAGVHGAAGMAERRGRLLRPWLDVARGTIVEYAEHHGLAWVEDESNASTRFNRNFLRHEVMPVLESRFPQAAASLARAAHMFGTTAGLLDELAMIDMAGDKRLSVARLRALSPARAANLLASNLRRHGVQIGSQAALEELLRQLIEAGCDSEIRVVLGACEIRRFHDEVWIEKPTLPVASTEWRGESSIPWGVHRIEIRESRGEGVGSALLMQQSLRFAPRRGGEAMQLRDDGPRRPLKDLLREAGVPPWRRKNVPLLFCGNELVWAAGIGIAAKYRCEPAGTGFLIEFDGVTW